MIRRLSDIPAELIRLSESGAETGRIWTLAQIAEHLARTIDWTTQSLKTDEPSPLDLPPARRFIARQLALIFGYIPRDVPTFGILKPPPDTEFSQAIDHLARSIDEFERSKSLISRHPFLGPFSPRGWRRFHIIHARHHLREIAKPA